MNTLFLFPNNLFEKSIIDDTIKRYQIHRIFLIEHSLFFNDKRRTANFGQIKLLFHKACCYYYADYLKTHFAKYHPQHIEYHTLEKFKTSGNIHCYQLYDNLLENDLKKEYPNLILIDNPSFLTNQQEIIEYLKFNKGKRFNQTSFYIWQRKRLDLLMNKDKPIGGKFTYDTENREKFNPDEKIPNFKIKIQNKYLSKSREYIIQHFSNNYPNIIKEYDLKNFIFPTTHQDAKKFFKKFLKDRLSNFGKYQDAISSDTSQIMLFHSGISSLINAGFLTPKYVIQEIIKYSELHKVPFNSTEGFIRQILGWREYCILIYTTLYSDLVEANYFNHHRKLNQKWYNGTTGIQPIDDCIQKAFSNGYLHHIERLMIVGQFMLLTGIQPSEVYRWFMEFSCDAYDWVMVFNVYAMSQYAYPSLSSKPYISSSNYLLKMSNYKKDEHWNKIWDALYWNFIDQHTKQIVKNPRLSMQVSFYNRKNKSDKENIEKISSAFLKSI